MHIWYGSLFFLLRQALESNQLNLPSCDKIFPSKSISSIKPDPTDSLIFSLCYSKRIRDLCREHCSFFHGVVDRTILEKASKNDNFVTPHAQPKVIAIEHKSTTVETISRTTSSPNGGLTKCPKPTPCIDDNAANSKFLGCCRDKGIPEKIHNLCNYKVNAMEIQNAVVDGSFPVKLMKIYQSCAANGQNNVDCCTERNLLSGRRSVCKQFCDPDNHEWPTTIAGSMKFYPCMQINPQIMLCHRASLT